MSVAFCRGVPLTSCFGCGSTQFVRGLQSPTEPLLLSNVHSLVHVARFALCVGTAGMTRLCRLVVTLLCTSTAALAPTSGNGKRLVRYETQRRRQLILWRAREHAHQRLERKAKGAAVAFTQADQKLGKHAGHTPIHSSKMQHKVQLANGLILLGTMGFSLVLFCLMHSHLQSQTRQLMVSSGSLFCTILIFMGLKKLWKLVGPGLGGLGWLLSTTRFLAFFGGLPLLAGHGRFPKIWRAVQASAGHLIGFAGADAGALILRMLAGTPGWYLLGVLAVQLLWVVMTWLATQVMQIKCSAASPSLDLRNSVDKEVRRMQDLHVEAGGFAMGFLMSSWVRFAVTGSLPGSRRVLTRADLALMGFATCLTFLALALGILLKKRLPRSLAGSSRGSSRSFCLAVSWLTEATSMTASWLLFFLLQWLCWHVMASGHSKMESAERLAAFMLQALVASAGAVAVLVMASTRGHDASMDCKLLRALALQIGYSWEVAIYATLVEMPGRGLSPEQRHRQGAGIIIGLLCGVVPAWLSHLAPHSEATQGKDACFQEASERVSANGRGSQINAEPELILSEKEPWQSLPEKEPPQEPPHLPLERHSLVPSEEALQAEDTDTVSPRGEQIPYDRGLSSASLGRPNRRFVEVESSSPEASERESLPPTPPPESPRVGSQSQPLGRRPVFYQRDDDETG